MLRERPLVAQVERTGSALEWARAHDVLEEKNIKFGPLIAILEALPLEPALPILRETYSPNKGRPAYDPLLLFRTELARRILRVDSRDDFAEKTLAPDKTFRLLLGYGIDGPVPCGQTLRRFEHRICPSRRRSVRMPKKHSHAHKGKNPTERAARFLLRHQGKPIPLRAPSSVDRLLRTVGFEPALSRGLIPDDAALIADGTFLPSRTRGQGRKSCTHGRTPCDCERIYTDPLARHGSDHHEQKTVYGYLANIACLDTLLGDPLVLSITMHPASRHDGIATFMTLARTQDLYPEIWGRISTLDAASDSDAHGRFLRAISLVPVIPLKAPGKGGYAIDNIPFTNQGVPLCAAGFPMLPHGSAKGRQRWICPGEVARSDVPRHMPCHQKGFRTLSFTAEDDPRLIAGVHREGLAFRKIYGRRAAIERAVNKPAMSDGNLEHTSRVQSRGRRHFDLFIEALIGYARAFIRWAKRNTPQGPSPVDARS